jgi:hypothetical protein
MAGLKKLTKDSERLDKGTDMEKTHPGQRTSGNVPAREARGQRRLKDKVNLVQIKTTVQLHTGENRKTKKRTMFTKVS